MGKKSKERRVYTKVFKAEAVALAEKREKPISQVAKDLGINENMLRRWMQASREMAGSGKQAFPGHGRPRDATNSCASAWKFARKSCRRHRRVIFFLFSFLSF